MSRRIPHAAPITGVAAMRAAEQRVFDDGVAVDEVMERAGLAVAHEVRRLAGGRPILIAAGPGSNGGDAYIAARHLAGWGLDVVVAAHGRPSEGAAGRAAEGWGGAVLAPSEAPPRPILVDGVFGTGASRGLSDDLAGWFDTRRADADLTIAIDLPSGIDADANDRRRTAAADVTVALGALKPEHLVGGDAARCGHLTLVDIGVPVETAARTIAPPRLPPLPDDVQKFTRGMVAVVGGAMPGASLLAATAAMHGGAGYTVLVAEQAGAEWPHALVRRTGDIAGLLDDARIGAAVIGPGLGRDGVARMRLHAALASPRDLVVDADALTLLAGTDLSALRADERQVYLTPHGGEFDRLFGGGGGNTIERTLAAARETGAIIVHKGPATVIATPTGEAIVAAGTTPWLSTAGTGDVLAGTVAARHAAGGGSALDRAAAAVWLHGRAAALAGVGFIADDVVRRLPQALEAAGAR